MDFLNDVRATLLYFDLFDHPLSKDELYTFFPKPLLKENFDLLLSRQKKIRSLDGFFHLRDDDEVVETRKRRERKAKVMLLAASAVGKLLGNFPFVRAVFLSGSLSKGVNDGGADIDLFIITAEQRLWICRSFMTAFKKIFLFDRKKFLCPNYFVTERHLEIFERNIFTATELVTLRPLFNEEKLQELLEANRWILEFFPNFQIAGSKTSSFRSPLQQILELPMGDGYTSNWDARLMYYFKGVWAKRYPSYSQSEREFQFRTTPFSSKVHPKDYQTKVLSEYEKRLHEEKIERLVEIDD